MKINPLNNKYLQTSGVEKTGKRKKASNSQDLERDTIHISAEAQKMNAQEINGKDLEEIKTRIEDKYYNSDEIIDSVAEAILKEVKSS